MCWPLLEFNFAELFATVLVTVALDVVFTVVDDVDDEGALLKYQWQIRTTAQTHGISFQLIFRHAYLGSSDVELIGSCCARRPLDPLVSGSFVRSDRTSLSASDD